MTQLSIPIPSGKMVSLERQNTRILGESGRPDWTHLPADLSHKILGMLGNSQEQIAFVQVCHEWSSVYFKEGTLDLSHCPMLKDRQLMALMRILKGKAKGLTILNINLSGCSLLTKEGLAALEGCTLTNCNLNGCSVDYQCIQMLKKVKSLEDLHLGSLIRTYSCHSAEQVKKELALNPMQGFQKLEIVYLGRRRVSLPKPPNGDPVGPKKAQY